MRRLLRDCPEVTAVFAMNDLLALGAIQAARENGLHVPRDISIVGYDDIPMAAMALPSLTTIHPSLEQVGAQALQLLEKR